MFAIFNPETVRILAKILHLLLNHPLHTFRDKTDILETFKGHLRDYNEKQKEEVSKSICIF